MVNSTLTGNTARLGGGGAISNVSGTVNVTNSIISGNATQIRDQPGGDGGGIYNNNGTVNVTNSTISGNTARNFDGIGGNSGGIFNVSGTVNVTNSTISGNAAQIRGGGISINSGTLTISNSTLSNNEADSLGGGIYTNGPGTVSIINSTLSNNGAGFEGGGIYTNGPGTVSIINSTLSGNTAGASGGGIFNNAGIDNVINSTLSGNTAGASGGGIFNDSDGTVNVTSSTLSGNVATSLSGGGIDTDGLVFIGNSIVAGNVSSSRPDVDGQGTFNSQGYNLIGNPSGVSGFVSTDLLNVDPKLAHLGNYGGATQTLALLPGSPAINAGGAGATSTDQHGIAAVGIRDIGAFESRGFTLTATSGTPQSTLVTLPFASPLVATVTSPFGEPVAGGSITFTAPTRGATATLSPLLASINSAGQASVNATANSLAGAYTVTATANGVTGSALFSLSNSLPQPTPQPMPQSTPSPSLPDPERRAVQQEPTPTYPTPPKPVAEVGQIARVDRVDTLQTALESSITEQFTTHLELKERPAPKSLPEVQGSLQKIETSAGVKPALFYISLLPSSVATSTSNDENQQPTLSYDPITGLPVIRQVSSAEPDLVLIVVPPTGSPILRKVPGVTRSKVLKLALTFRNEVADPSKTLTRSYLPSAKQLYSWLIKPIEPELKAQGIDTLMFIMDTNLRFLPLAALYDDQDQKFLVEKYSIGLLPSLSLTDLRYGNVRNAQVLAAGASTFTDANQNPLLGVKLELSTILGGNQWQGRSLLDKDFTFNALQKQRRDNPFGIIHLATHGAFLPGKIGESYIQLFDDKLGLDQIRKLGWNNPPAELVVLSACQMALGDENAELGFAGFAVKAGVKSALASLWNISDEGTIGLMSRFYEELRAVPTKSGALRQAQIAMLKGQIRIEDGKLRYGTNEALPLPPELAKLSRQSFSHPYYWSAFTMIGSPW